MEKTKNLSVVCSNCGGQIDVNTMDEKVQCPYCGTNYVVSELLNESDEVRIEKIKSNTQKQIEQEKLRHEVEQKKSQEEKEEAEKFKKGKFSKVLILFAIFDVLMCATSFRDGKILAGLLAAIMTAVIIAGYLMKSHTIKEPKKGIGTIIAIVALILFIPFFGLYNSNGSSNSSSKATKINISNVELIDELPIPDKLYGRISTDRKDLLDIEIADVTKQDFKDYVEKCIDKGYTIDKDDTWDTVFDAYNEKGYNIRVNFSDYGKKTTMDITLKAPEKMEEFEWPTSGLGTKVPNSKSNYGRICWDNSESFIVHVGNTSKTEYNEYVKECENNGYTLEYSKGEKTYSAKNEEGYKLSLMYLGGDRMEISVKVPDEKSSTNTTTTESSKSAEESKKENTKNTEENKKETTKSTKDDTSKKSSSSGIGKEFKEAMDSYEKFMDEYIAFMKKYKKSNGTDMSLLADYSKYMSRYADMTKKFEKWEDEDINDAETAYYIKVQTRVNKKLLEVAN